MLGRAGYWLGCVVTGHAPVFALTAAGERLRVPPDLRYTSVATFLLRDWSEPELRQLDRFVGPGEVFVDVGANIGLYTLKAARLVGPTGRVIAVEPGAVAGDQLLANVALNGFDQVRLVRGALSDRSGEGVLRHVPLGNDPQAYSLLPDPAAPDGERVRTLTLDELCAECGLDRLDCLKIDVEGGEEQVIAGGLSAIERHRPTLIMEVNCPILERVDRARDGAWQLLAARGYQFSLLTAAGLTPLSAFPDSFGNVIAYHPARAAPRA